jgi:hypothetical protein
MKPVHEQLHEPVPFLFGSMVDYRVSKTPFYFGRWDQIESVACLD